MALAVPGAKEKNQAALEARHQEIEEAIDRPTPGTLTPLHRLRH
jgi:hypothetical protein